MKVSEECYPCLMRLVRQAAELATEDADLRAKAIEAGLKLLDSQFSLDKTSIAVAMPLHRAVKAITHNADPYLGMKEAEVAMARQLDVLRDCGPGEGLRAAIILAVRGNTIDFFRDPEQIRRDLMLPVEFAIDNTAELEARLKSAKRILYLADNAGEVLFDLKLVRTLGEFAPVTYVVKEAPVQNDVTLYDLDHFGLSAELPRVITTGTDTPGVEMDLASSEFKREFEVADLVLAKGMGYWETLSELPPPGKVFHLLKAKCLPVANSLGVPLDSYVALLR